MNKILAGLGTLQSAMTVKLNHLAAMEINAGGRYRVACQLCCRARGIQPGLGQCPCCTVGH